MSDNTQSQPAPKPALAQRRPEKAAGPLIVSRSNPRYFTVASDAEQKAVYLTASREIVLPQTCPLATLSNRSPSTSPSRPPATSWATEMKTPAACQATNALGVHVSGDP